MMAEVDIVRVLRLRAEEADTTQDDAVLMLRAAGRIEAAVRAQGSDAAAQPAFPALRQALEHGDMLRIQHELQLLDMRLFISGAPDV